MSDETPGITDITDVEEPHRSGGVRWFAVVLLVGYLALLALGAWSLRTLLGDGALSWGVTAAFVLLFAAGWRTWLAAGSRRRLAFRERLTVHLIAGPVVVVLASLSGIWLPALLALSVIVMCDALNERDRRPAMDGSAPDLI